MPENRVFLKYYSDLVTTFSSTNLYHHFVSPSIITLVDCHEICSEKNPDERAKLLLQKIGAALKINHSPSFYSMLTIMREHGSESMKRLANKISQSSELKGSDIGNKYIAR